MTIDFFTFGEAAHDPIVPTYIINSGARTLASEGLVEDNYMGTGPHFEWSNWESGFLHHPCHLRSASRHTACLGITGTIPWMGVCSPLPSSKNYTYHGYPAGRIRRG